MVELVGGQGQRRGQPQRALAGRADEQPALEAVRDDVRRRTRSISTPSSSPRPRTFGSRRRDRRAVRDRHRASSSSSTVSHDCARLPRTRRGCRRTCSRGRRARMPRRPSSATSRQPIGSPFASPFASVTASGRTPSCSNAKNVPVRPTPVCTSSKTSSAPASSASARAASTNRESSGMIPPSPSTGSSRMQPVSSVTAASSDATSFGCANATPGSSGSNAARFAGWPVTESAPNVRPWNEPSSATTPGLPGRLARVLQRGLDRFGAGVAEERLRAAEARGELLGELRHRLGPVEVRHVPEPVELRVRGGERRRVAVAEADDGDPGEKVEVAPAVGVDEPRALAARRTSRPAARRSAEPRARRRRSRDHRRRADLGADAEPRRDHRGADLRDDPARELAGVEQPVRLAAASVCATAPSR